MAPKKNTKNQLLGIYNASVLLLPSLHLNTPIIAQDLDADAKQAKIAAAMHDLFGQIKHQLDLMPLLQEQWEDCENFLAAGVDLDADSLLDVFEKAEKLIRAQSVTISTPDENLTYAEAPIAETSNLSKKISVNFASAPASTSVNHLAAFKEMYIKYKIYEQKYKNLVNSANGSSSSSSNNQPATDDINESDLTLNDMIDKLQLIVFSEINLSHMARFLDAETRLKLQTLQKKLSDNIGNLTISLQLFSEYAKALCDTFGWGLPILNKTQVEALQGNYQWWTTTPMLNTWSGVINKPNPVASTNHILGSYQHLYQKFIDLEKDYHQVFNKTNPADESFKLITLDPKWPVDIRDIKDAILSCIARMDLNIIGGFMDDLTRESLVLAQKNIISPPQEGYTEKLSDLFTEFEAQCKPVLLELVDNLAYKLK